MAVKTYYGCDCHCEVKCELTCLGQATIDLMLYLFITQYPVQWTN